MINKRGFWEVTDAEHHQHDPMLEREIIRFINSKHITTVLDLGCGMGEYMRGIKAKSKRLKTIHGFDGNPNTHELTGGLGQTLDLSVPIIFGKYNIVISLEVGEHIPKEYEQTFIDNICHASDRYVLLSWGIPGQDGLGHVNCQPNEYVIEQMQNRGFKHLPKESQQFRDNAFLWWFKNTLMLFKN